MAVFRCAGRNRINEDTEEPVCEHQAERPWRGRCPSCGQAYACDRIGVEKSRGKLKSAADSLDDKYAIKYIATGHEAFDKLLSGGVVESQAILLAGGPGSRKTSLALMVLDEFAKRTKRPLLFASAEQNEGDVMAFCRLLKVNAPSLKVMGNLAFLDDLFNVCDSERPIITVLDSLQALSQKSNMSAEELSRRFVEYCKRTKMIGVMVNHMTTGNEIKGGTGPAHYVDTVLAYEPFFPEFDGKPKDLFGRDVCAQWNIVWNAGGSDRFVEGLRILRTQIKNRYGSVGDHRVYYFTPSDGEYKGAMIELKPKSNIIDVDFGG